MDRLRSSERVLLPLKVVTLHRHYFPVRLFLWNNVSGPFVFVCVAVHQKLKGNQNNCDFSAAFVAGEQFRLIPTNAEIFAPVISMPQSKDSRPQYTTKKKEKKHKNTILENIKKGIPMLVSNERVPGNRFVRPRYLDIFFPPKAIIFNCSRVNSYYIAWPTPNIRIYYLLQFPCWYIFF